MAYLMTSSEFIAKIKEVQQHDTVYMLGTFGQPVTESLIQSKKAQLPGWYTQSRVNLFRKYIGKRFAFDCIGLIKAVLWDWDADWNNSRGGAVYAGNGVPDISDQSCINMCTGVSGDFSTISPGEVVWLPGHIGVYIGSNLVIECTPKWSNNVQYSALGNLGGRAGYNTRSWNKHGKLPWISYDSAASGSTSSPSAPKERAKLTVDGSHGPLMTEAKQVFYKTGTVDGIISGQPNSNKSRNYALVQGGVTEWLDDSRAGGSLVFEAEQRQLSNLGYYAGDIDGWQGPEHIKGKQQMLADAGLYTGKIDSSYGPETCKAEQQWLNARWNEWKK